MRILYYLTLFIIPHNLLLEAKKCKVRLIDATDHLIRYEDALKMQQKLVDYHVSLQEIKKSPYEENIVGSMIMLQHKPVYTLGSGTVIGSGPFSSISKDGSVLEYEMFQVERAGQATYHGPGQLVIYPILDLSYFYKDINWYLRALEDIAIQTIDMHGIKSERKNLPGYTGVWVGDSKLAAIGIKIKRWVTMHGMSLNVNPDMRYFDNIIPCGISDKSVGSISQYNKNVCFKTVCKQVETNFAEAFDVQYDTELSLDGLVPLNLNKYLDR